ncbi:MAG TPA: ABC transporter permease subunit [Jiangellaceae bacterium]|nr:ABC transporter permease subunit [Jiangellaceae bacterium]
MSDALKFEWVRLRTLRSTYWLIGLALVLSAIVAVALSFATRNEAIDTNVVAAMLTGGGEFAPLPFTAVFMAIIGIFATGHEYRHGTIQPTLTAVPSRSRLLVAKLTSVAATSVVITLASVAINWISASVIRGEALSLSEAPLPEVLAGYVALTLLWAVLGLALGLLFRGVPSALVVILVVPLVVETLLTGLSQVPALDWLRDVVPYLPFSAGQRLVSVGIAESMEGMSIELLDRWAGGGVFALFTAVILAAAWYLFEKKDA